MSRFDVEQSLIDLVGHPPKEGDAFVRDRNNWRLDPVLAPTVAGGEVTGDVTPDFKDGQVINYTLVGDVTFHFALSARHGRTYFLILDQDETGSRTATWDAEYQWGSEGPPTLSTTPASRDIISFIALQVSGDLNFYGIG